MLAKLRRLNSCENQILGTTGAKKEIFEREHMTLVRRIPLLVLAVFISLSTAFGQTSGSIRGTVQDPPGAIVAGTKVTATWQESKTSHVVSTSASGQFAFKQNQFGGTLGGPASVSSVRPQNQREVSRMRCGQLWKLPLRPAITGTLGAVGQGEHLSVTSVAVRNLEKRAVWNSVISGKPMTSS